MEDIVHLGHDELRLPERRRRLHDRAASTPTPRATCARPGAATGMTLFEIAIDEMAYAAERRSARLPAAQLLRHRRDERHAVHSQGAARGLRRGRRALRLGEARRRRRARCATARELVGWGVATGMWDAMFSKTSARAKLHADGHLEVASAAVRHRHRHLHGDDAGRRRHARPAARAASPPSSATAACRPRRSRAAPGRRPRPARRCSSPARRSPRSCSRPPRKIEGKPLGGASSTTWRSRDGRIVLQRRSVASASHRRSDARRGPRRRSRPRRPPSAGIGGMISMMRKSRNTHSAIFAEVKVDEELGVVRVTRIVIAVAAGPHHQPEDGAQPDPRRRGDGHRHGAARGDLHRPPRSAAS